MAVALRTNSEVEARVVAALLDGYSIRCWIHSSLPSSIYPLRFHGLEDAALLVPESQLAEAEHLIGSHRSHLSLVYSRRGDR
jgi:Putative prokaryotic signal transducing protein